MDLIRFIFACFGIFANTIYSHHSFHIRLKIFVQIRIHIFNLMQKIHVEANIRFRANIRLTFPHTGEIRFEAKWIKCSFIKEYSLCMSNSLTRFDAKQANKTCFIRFEVHKYLLYICFYSLWTEYSRRTLFYISGVSTMLSIAVAIVSHWALADGSKYSYSYSYSYNLWTNTVQWDRSPSYCSTSGFCLRRPLHHAHLSF